MSTIFTKQYNSKSFAITQDIFYGSVQMKDADKVHNEALENAKKRIKPVIKHFENEMKNLFDHLTTFKILKFDPEIKLENTDISNFNSGIKKSIKRYLFSYPVNTSGSSRPIASNAVSIYFLLEKKPSEEDKIKAREILDKLNILLKEKDHLHKN